MHTHEQQPRHAHGKRLACFRPRQRFRCDADDNDRFEHVEHADAHDHSSDECKDNSNAAAAAATNASSPHCYRTSSSSLSKRPFQVACDCEYHVYRCEFALADASWTTHEAAYIERIANWTAAFDTHDWCDERISQKWKANQQRYALGATTSTNSAATDDVQLRSHKFDALLRAGVPPHLRGRVWFTCSGAATKQQQSAESYSALVARLHTLSRSACMEIEKDLPRTFPLDYNSTGTHNHPNSSLHELRRVLQAYSLRNPVIGYCQSMNFLAAVLLQHMAEAEAFWTLASVVEDLAPLYHTRSMAGSRADERVFRDLVYQQLPAVALRLEALSVDYAPFTLKWFLCLFVHTLPFEVAMRLWDVVMCDGSHVLLRVGLVVLKLLAPQIDADCVDAFDVYERLTLSMATLHELTAPYRMASDACVCDTFVRLVMDDASARRVIGPIAFDALHALRVYYITEIEAEAAANDAHRAAKRAAATSANVSLSAEAQKMLEYDFVDEFAHDDEEEEDAREDALDVQFHDLYDSDASSSSECFVDVVKVEGVSTAAVGASTTQQRCH